MLEGGETGVQQALTMAGWFLSPVCAALVTALIANIKMNKERERMRKKAKTEHDKAMEDGMMALLRQQIIDYHRQYVASGKPCPVRIKEQATKVHDAYAALGGNGTGTQLWKEIMEAHVE